MKKRVILLVRSALLAVFLPAALFSQGAPPEPLTRLMNMEGHWIATATLNLEGKSYSVEYHISFKKTADGSGLYADEWFDSPDLGKMRGGDLIGLNPNDGKIHWFSVDNTGTAHEHVGQWTSPTHFHMEYQGRKQGKRDVEKIDLELPGRDEAHFKLTGSLGGEVLAVYKGTFHRVGDMTGSH